MERIVIPTYPTGEPDNNPMFLEKRVYQGSSGAVYPFAVIDRVSDERIDRQYDAVFLENDFLLIMVLPELGGRLRSRCRTSSSSMTISRAATESSARIWRAWGGWASHFQEESAMVDQGIVTRPGRRRGRSWKV